MLPFWEYYSSIVFRQARKFAQHSGRLKTIQEYLVDEYLSPNYFPDCLKLKLLSGSPPHGIKNAVITK